MVDVKDLAPYGLLTNHKFMPYNILYSNLPNLGRNRVVEIRRGGGPSPRQLSPREQA
jgi:hypothetical protein